MLSPDVLLAQLQRLARNTANPPEPEGMVELCADWMELLGPDLDDGAFREAVTRHLRASKFWPTPSELLADVQSAQRPDSKQLEAKGERLFAAVAKARSSCGSDPTRARHHLVHYGVDPEDVDRCLAAVGRWASFDPGDPVHNPQGYGFARRAFGKAYAAEAGTSRLLLAEAPRRLIEVQ